MKKKEYTKEFLIKLTEIIKDLVNTLLKLILIVLFLWVSASLIYWKPIPLFSLIQDTVDSFIKEGSRTQIILKRTNSFIDEKTKTIDYFEYYNSNVMEKIDLPMTLRMGDSYLKEIEKYNLSENNTKLLKVFMQELNSFHSKILLNLFKDEREAFNALFKIMDKNKCTFEYIRDANYKAEIYHKVLLEIKKTINLTLIYFDKFDKDDEKFNNNLSSFYLVSFSPYYTGGMCNTEDLEKISK